jgi:hypothetical protein
VDSPKAPPLPRRSKSQTCSARPKFGWWSATFEATRWTGRPGYPVRRMIGMALAKSIYAVPTWTRTVALVSEHAALRAAITGTTRVVPSGYACYRFAAKLRTYSDMLAACIDRVTAGLHDAKPGMGANLAIDGSDMPAYANGQRFVSKGGRERRDAEFSDPDASWGHRSAVSTRRAAVLRLQAQHGRLHRHRTPGRVERPHGPRAESTFALPLIDKARERGLAVETCANGQGLRPHLHLRRLGGPQCPPRDPAPRDARREVRPAQAADVRTRRVDVRRS